MRHGFSLVELSIVLVIIGLITGGIIGGQSLVRASEVRSVIADSHRYIGAIHAFRDQYNSLPGDTAYAVSAWGSAGGTGADVTCYNSQALTSPATCNGNGNGQIASSVYAHDERFLMWKHLANAGVIEGNFLGRTGTTGTSFTLLVGENVPNARVDAQAYFTPYYANYSASTDFVGSGLPSHILRLDGGGPLTTDEAYSIDRKIDDGSPVYGNVISYIRTYRACASSDADSAGYDMSLTGKRCSLSFKFQ